MNPCNSESEHLLKPQKSLHMSARNLVNAHKTDLEHTKFEHEQTRETSCFRLDSLEKIAFRLGRS